MKWPSTVEAAPPPAWEPWPSAPPMWKGVKHLSSKDKTGGGAAEDQRAIEALPLADLQKITEGLEDDAQAEDVKNTAAESEAAASQAPPAQPAGGLASAEEEADAGGKRQSDSE